MFHFRPHPLSAKFQHLNSLRFSTPTISMYRIIQYKHALELVIFEEYFWVSNLLKILDIFSR
jgi:hypothetical protein